MPPSQQELWELTANRQNGTLASISQDGTPQMSNVLYEPDVATRVIRAPDTPLHRTYRAATVPVVGGLVCSVTLIVAGKIPLDLANAPSSVPADFPLRCGGKSTTATPEVFPGMQTRYGGPPNDERDAQPLEHANHDGGVPVQLPPHDRLMSHSGAPPPRTASMVDSQSVSTTGRRRS
jgi:hypothetical protein